MITEFFQPHPLREFRDYESYWQLSKRVRGTGLANYETVRDYIADADSIIDVGCGTGEFLRIVKERHPRMRLYGLDIAAQAAAITRRKGIAADAVNLETQRLRKRASLVTCFCVLEHVQNAEVLFGRMQELASDRLIVSIPNPAFLLYRIRYAMGSFPVMSCLYHMKEHIRFWTPKDFRYWLRTLFPEWQVREIKACATDPLWARVWPTMLANNLYYVLERRRKTKRA